MASVQDLKRRVRSVKNTRKITKAMELVASARLRRAQTRIEAMRPYAETMRELIAGVGRASSSVRGLPLLAQREEEKTVGVVALTGDRGLAGPFNAQIIRRSFALERQLRAEGKSVRFIAVGKKGRSTFAFRRYETSGEFVGFTDRPAYGNARDIASDLIAAYVDGDVDRVEIFYNHYISPLQQRVTRETLLPLQQASILEEAEGDEAEQEEREHQGHRALVDYEPEPEEILQRLVPVYVEISIFRALLESTASEHGARMTAMRNASENAGELIDTYTLQMNRQRQADITQEIMEVVAGAESLV